MSKTLDNILQTTEVERRRASISSALSQADLQKYFVRSESGYLELPIITIDNDCLFYRVDNGRLLTEIAAYAKSAGFSVDELKERAEDLRIQHALHDLLIEKARDERAPVFIELELHGLQIEPLLITGDGLVVNGNRRLASMRTLFARNPDEYASFKTINVAVLPETLTAEAIEYIEASLQMAPDLKLSYGWINRRLKLREHARDLPRDRIIEAYRFKDTDAVNLELAELHLTEAYLSFIGQSDDYERVADDEEYFTLLYEHLSDLEHDHLRDLWQFAGFAMIASRKTIDRPVLHYFPFTRPIPPALPNWVMRSLAADRGLVGRQAIGQNEPLAPNIAARLHPIISDPRNVVENSNHVIALIDTLKGNEQQLLGAARMLGQLRQFRRTLEELGLSALDEQQSRQIHAEMVAVKDLLESFKREATTPQRIDMADQAKGWYRKVRRLFSKMNLS